MMATPLKIAMAEAYHLDQVVGDRSGGVKVLQALIVDDAAAREEALAEAAKLKAFLASPRGRADHLSRVNYDLVTAALPSPAAVAPEPVPAPPPPANGDVISVGGFDIVAEGGGLSIHTPDGQVIPLVSGETQ